MAGDCLPWGGAGHGGGGGGVPGCVLQISCIQGTPLYPVSCRTLQFFATSAMDADHIDTGVHQKVTVMGQVLQGLGQGHRLVLHR